MSNLPFSKRKFALLLSVLLAFFLSSVAWADNTGKDAKKDQKKVKKAAVKKEKSSKKKVKFVAPKHISTTDHRKLPILQQKFATGPDVTKACLSCHTEAAKQFHKSKHWNWRCPDNKKGIKSGKAFVINNFCIGIRSSEPRCTSCHAGYGWKDKTFNFKSEANVDCLVCHDTTGKYKKFPTLAGHPNYKPKKWGKKIRPAVDLTLVAKNVGLPSRRNCGTCHFNGGGGDGVKHGDLDSSLLMPDKKLDVHMDAKGLNFSCTKCHESDHHRIGGGCLSRLDKKNPNHAPEVSCIKCHTNKPHKKTKFAAHLNDHVKTIACQTCHIPRFARGGKPTKMYWDWSQAGKFKNGKKSKKNMIVKRDPKTGWMTYHTKKGSFVWKKNVIPEYYWWNGRMKRITIEDKVDPTKVTYMNKPLGGPNDSHSKIYPFKVHRGKQIYDKKYKTLINPKLFGKKGSGAYWKEFDWNKAAAAGMKYIGRPYSGSYGFLKTAMFWPQNHMVAPAKDALTCAQCHTREKSRLAAVTGVYILGRDHLAWLDWLGWIAFILSFLAIIVHAVLRYTIGRKVEAHAESVPTRKVLMYKRFERFWHWAQAFLIFALMWTGFEIHGTFHVLGFQQSVLLHDRLVLLFLALIIFAVFWHFTTGEWKQYIPTTKNIKDMVRYYTKDIFFKAPHPVDKTREEKFNPLQRLTYLALKTLIFPVQIGTGLLLYFHEDWSRAFDVNLKLISNLHVAATFALLSFVVMHVYLTTTGHTIFANIKAMITGWDYEPIPVEAKEETKSE